MHSRYNLGHAQKQRKKVFLTSVPFPGHQYPPTPTPTPKCLNKHQHLGYFLIPIQAEIKRTDTTGPTLGQLLF